MSNPTASTVSLDSATFGEITTRKVAPKVTPTTSAKPAAKRVRKPAAAKPIRKVVPEQPELLKSKAAEKPLKEDYTYLADKEPTDLHKQMAEWMSEVTGVEVTAKQAQIVSVLRHEHQRSDANQEMLAEKRKQASAKKAAAEKAKVAKEKALLKKLQDKFASEAKTTAEAK